MLFKKLHLVLNYDAYNAMSFNDKVQVLLEYQKRARVLLKGHFKGVVLVLCHIPAVI